MSNVKVVLNKESIKEYMKSNEMKAACEERANTARAKLGEGYKVTSMSGKTRCNASILAESKEAKRENRENNTILKAVGEL